MQTGDSYFDSKRFRDILMSYENSVKSGQPIYLDADDLTDIADYYNLTGEPDKAGQTIDYALKINPSATLPLVFKAREALMKGRYDEADEYAERIVNKLEPDYKFLKAELLIAKNDIEQAEKVLISYYDYIDEDEEEDFILDAANIYVDYGLYAKAYEWMCKCECEDSDNTDFKELMARVLFGLGRYEESESIFNGLIDKDPYSKKYWTALASSQFMGGKYNEAITSSEYASAIDPEDPDAMLTKANALFRLENYAEALVYYKKYSDVLPEDDMGLLNVATCMINLDMFDEAITYLKKASTIAPAQSETMASIYRELAFSYSAIKMTDKALEALDEAEKLDCDMADLMVLRGHVLLENNRYEEAERMFTKALSDSEKSPKIVLRIIVSFYDNKYIKPAYHMFKELFENVGDDFNEGYSYMALCCWDLRLKDEFLKYLDIAIKKNSNEAQKVLGHLFPLTMKPEEYYNFIANKLNKAD